MYYLSRSELLRMIEIQDEETLLLIGPPGHFIDWFDPCMGSRTTVSDSIPTDPPYDRILLWGDDIPDKHMIERAAAALSAHGQLWAVLPAGLFESETKESGSPLRRVTLLDHEREVLRLL